MSSEKVSIEDARKRLGDFVNAAMISGTTTIITRNGRPAARIVPLEDNVTTTTQLHGFATYARAAQPEDVVRDFLGEFEADYDVDGLTNAYRGAINAELAETGIVLRGSDFYSNYPAPTDATELIEQALESVDLGEIAPQFDQTEG